MEAHEEPARRLRAVAAKQIRGLLRDWEEPGGDGLFLGIVGAPRCQVCGAIGRFSGLFGAMASHIGSEFVGNGLYGHRGHSRAEQERALERAWRYCEICCAPVARERLAHGVCPSCLDVVRSAAPAHRAADVMYRLLRVRPGTPVPPQPRPD